MSLLTAKEGLREVAEASMVYVETRNRELDIREAELLCKYPSSFGNGLNDIERKK